MFKGAFFETHMQTTASKIAQYNFLNICLCFDFILVFLFMKIWMSSFEKDQKYIQSCLYNIMKRHRQAV